MRRNLINGMGRRMDKWERRDKKKSRKWYKRHMHNNRKALEVIIEVVRNRMRRGESTNGNAISSKS